MAKTEHYHTKFEAECFYHVYNRSINKEVLFKDSDNYRFFLKKYQLYLSGYVNTYAYCLLGNHFHLLMEIKTLPTLQGLTKLKLNGDDNSVHLVISHQLRKLFQSYALAFNKRNDREGSLFQKPFKRVKVDEDSYLSTMISYIHLNPQKHGLVSGFRKWSWSSYDSFVSSSKTQLSRNQVLNWFGGKEEFIKFHKENELVLDERLRIDE